MKVGILGAGQLARMLSLAAIPLGIETISLVSNPDQENNGVSPVFPAGWDQPKALADFAAQVDVVTYETENIPCAIAHALQAYCSVLPTPKILAATQDRLDEKNLLRSLSLATANFQTVSSLAELNAASTDIGLPAVLKTRRMGYDGKGQIIIRNQSELAKAWQTLNNDALILEQFIHFEAEVSLILVRNAAGDLRFYPLTHNQHREGILFVSRAPYANTQLQTQAETIAARLVKATDYVGVLAIEFFQVGSELLINELAPRVHNSGHWTIEGAATSQFENHLRAILNLPLGATTARGFSAMVNIVGQMPEKEAIMALDYAHFHSYGKTARPKRKLGHVTVNCDDKQVVEQQLEKLLRLCNKF